MDTTPSNSITTEEKIDKILVLTVNNSEDLKIVKENLSDLTTVVNSHTTILNQHTNILDGLFKQDQDTSEKNIVDPVRLSRIEEDVKLLANKAGLKLNW